MAENIDDVLDNILLKPYLFKEMAKGGDMVWSVGALVRWSVGGLRRWSVGALRRWSVGALRNWSVGALERTGALER